MTLARREMGDDAILIQTQKRETVDPAKRFEVTFGIVPGANPTPPPAKSASKPPSVEASTDPGMETEVARELGSLRRELISLQIMLRQSSFGKSNGPQNNDAAYEAYAVLLGNDIDEELAAELIRLIEPGSKSPADAVRSQLATQIHTDSTVAQDGKAVVLMGPPASGKTTALIKLAVEYGLKLGNPIEIFSLSKGKANVDRTLEAMTAILGVPCEALPNAAALAAALDRPRAAGTLVLVDTNGYGMSAADEDMELAAVLDSGEKADVHLVLSAAWHRVSIRQTVDNFEIFQPSRLLFTMLDQAAVYGPLIQEAWRTQKPLSFVSGGKAGATALRPADLKWIVERMYGVARETVSARD
jgi:flagellar biosynthesis protein FlhF